MDYLNWNPSDGPQNNSENAAFMYLSSQWADLPTTLGVGGNAVAKALITPGPATLPLMAGVLGLFALMRQRSSSAA